jgi:hypothetical protein
MGPWPRRVPVWQNRSARCAYRRPLRKSICTVRTKTQSDWNLWRYTWAKYWRLSTAASGGKPRTEEQEADGWGIHHSLNGGVDMWRVCPMRSEWRSDGLILSCTFFLSRRWRWTAGRRLSCQDEAAADASQVQTNWWGDRWQERSIASFVPIPPFVIAACLAFCQINPIKVTSRMRVVNQFVVIVENLAIVKRRHRMFLWSVCLCDEPEFVYDFHVFSNQLAFMLVQ